MIVLWLHALIVIVHMMWLFWKRESSDTWESPTEMMALTITSPPPKDDILKNADNGIRSRRTYKTIVRVRAHPIGVFSRFGGNMDLSMQYAKSPGPLTKFAEDPTSGHEVEKDRKY